MRKRYRITFPPEESREPIIYQLAKSYDVVPNIIRATIQPGAEGVALIELTGNQENIEKAEAFLASTDLLVEKAPIEIVRDEDRCVDCGLCVSVCRSGALQMDEEFRLEVDRSKCVVCEACIPVCPRRALTVTV